MNPLQSLPSSCYLNTDNNADVLKSNVNSTTPKSQKRKQRLHLGAKRVDPALFTMIEEENEKKMLVKAATNRSREDKGKTHTNCASTEEQDNEKESYILKHGSPPHGALTLQRGSNNTHIADDSSNHGTHSENSNYSSAKANEDCTANSSVQQTGKNSEPTKPPLIPSNTDEAQKKFRSAKSISSERYFNDIMGGSVEHKSDLSRFSNCTSISSDDVFNRKPYEPDLEDLFLSSLDSISYEELAVSLKNGVIKVAGKLGSALNSFASRLPHEFGEY